MSKTKWRPVPKRGRPATGLGSKSIADFCASNQISTTVYYNMRARGIGPAEMRIGNIVRISSQAEADWQIARAYPTGQEAEEVARRAEVLRARSLHAVKRSIVSPNHISKQRQSA